MEYKLKEENHLDNCSVSWLVIDLGEIITKNFKVTNIYDDMYVLNAKLDHIQRKLEMICDTIDKSPLDSGLNLLMYSKGVGSFKEQYEEVTEAIEDRIDNILLLINYLENKI
jgi:hypothetical protein